MSIVFLKKYKKIINKLMALFLFILYIFLTMHFFCGIIYNRKRKNKGSEKMNTENLKCISEFSADEQRRMRSAGGKASGEARRRRKTQREFLINALEMNVKTVPKLRKLAEQMGLDVENCTLQELLTVKLLLNTYSKCDVSSLNDIIKILGEQQANVENNGILTDLTRYLSEKKENDKS